MAVSEAYLGQVALLVQLLPLVAEEGDFALKGGTGINFFYRDLPRLSVDIDLAYLPIEDRAASFTAVNAALVRIAERAAKLPGARTTLGRLAPENAVFKVVVQTGRTQVKIEANPVLRGSVHPPEMREASPRVQAEFGFARMQLLGFFDIYAGKLVATLDRQHPRDLFDVQHLLANEGITDDLREAFLVYLLGHNRGFHEVLDPGRLEIHGELASGFIGMTDEPVAIDALYETRERLIAELVGGMPERHRRFLVGFMEGTPDWSLLAPAHIQELPSVRWRMMNLEKLTATRRRELVEALEAALGS